MVVAGLLWCVVIVLVQVGIEKRVVDCVGYSYGSVVLRREWWRLAVAPFCHRERPHCLLCVVGVFYVALVHSVWRPYWLNEVIFFFASLLVAVFAEAASLAIVGLSLAAGAQELDDDEGSWVAHGSCVVALTWMARGKASDSEDDLLGRRHWLLALMFIFSAQLVAPREPVLPLATAFCTGFFLSQCSSIDDTLRHPYWAFTTLSWIAFFLLASLKATRPQSRVLCLSYSHFPAARFFSAEETFDEEQGIFDEFDDDGSLVEPHGPDGLPVFHIIDRSDDDRQNRQRAAAAYRLFADQQQNRRQPASGGFLQQDPFLVANDHEELAMRRHLLRGDPGDFPF